jgi:hypothetical protein
MDEFTPGNRGLTVPVRSEYKLRTRIRKTPDSSRFRLLESLPLGAGGRFEIIGVEDVEFVFPGPGHL